MPPLIAGAALGSLLIAGFVYSDVWSDILHHPFSFGRANEQTVPPDSRGAKHRKGTGSRHEPKAALTPHPVESQASIGPVAAASTAPKTEAAGPAATPGTPMLSTAPAAAAVSAQKPAGAPAAPGQRGQITVKYGDTLENIAIRYFGSTSGLNALIAANPQVTDINRLTVGQIIYLPRGITPKASHDQTATAPAVPNADSPAR
jgi:phage tail protein X